MRTARMLLCLPALAIQAETIQPALLFSIDAVSSDYLLGAVGDIEVGPQGELILLDRQLSELKVFDAQGEYLRTISRKGEGPGEMTECWEIEILPDGRILMPCRLPTRWSTIWLDGSAGDEVPLPQEIRTAASFFGNFASCGPSLLFKLDQREHEPNVQTVHFRWYALRASEFILLAEASVRNQVHEEWTAMSSDSFPFGLCAAHRDGSAFLALERELYRIRCLDGEMQETHVIDRDVPALKKSDEEYTSELRRLTSRGAKLGVELSRTKPNLSALIARPKGRLFVQTTSAAAAAHEAGKLGSFDVYDPNGEFQGTLEFDLALNSEDDLVRWSDHRLFIVRNGIDALRSSANRSNDEDNEIEGDWELRIDVYELPEL